MKILQILLITCIIAILSTSSFASEKDTTIDSNVSLTSAVSLMNQESYEEAHSVLTKLYSEKKDREVQFLLGIVSVKLQKYIDAILIFEELQVVSPSPRIEMELANAYLLSGNYTRSRQLFTNVYNSNPPEDIKEAIGDFLALLNKLEHSPESALALMGKKQGHQFAGRFSIAFEENSNPRMSPPNNRIETVVGDIMLSSDVEEKADFLNSYEAELRYSYYIPDSSWLIKTSALANIGFYASENDLDYQFYLVKAGLGYEKETYGFDVLGRFTSYTQDHDSIMQSTGWELNGYYAITPRWVAFAGWQHDEKEYFDYSYSYANNNRFYVGTSFQFKETHTILLTASYEDESTTISQESFSRYGFYGRYSVRLPYSFTPYVFALFQKSQYEGEEWLFETTRQDNEYQLGIGVQKTLWESPNKGLLLNTDLQYRYADRMSSIDLYDAERHSVSLQFNLYF